MAYEQYWYSYLALFMDTFKDMKIRMIKGKEEGLDINWISVEGGHDISAVGGWGEKENGKNYNKAEKVNCNICIIL